MQKGFLDVPHGRLRFPVFMPDATFLSSHAASRLIGSASLRWAAFIFQMAASDHNGFRWIPSIFID